MAVAASYYTFIAVVVRAAAYRDAAAVLVDGRDVLDVLVRLVREEGAASYYYFADDDFGTVVSAVSASARPLLRRCASLFFPARGRRRGCSAARASAIRGARRLFDVRIAVRAVLQRQCCVNGSLRPADLLRRRSARRFTRLTAC